MNMFELFKYGPQVTGHSQTYQWWTAGHIQTYQTALCANRTIQSYIKRPARFPRRPIKADQTDLSSWSLNYNIHEYSKIKMTRTRGSFILDFESLVNTQENMLRYALE